MAKQRNNTDIDNDRVAEVIGQDDHKYDEIDNVFADIINEYAPSIWREAMLEARDDTDLDEVLRMTVVDAMERQIQHLIAEEQIAAALEQLAAALVQAEAIDAMCHNYEAWVESGKREYLGTSGLRLGDHITLRHYIDIYRQHGAASGCVTMPDMANRIGHVDAYSLKDADVSDLIQRAKAQIIDCDYICASSLDKGLAGYMADGFRDVDLVLGAMDGYDEAIHQGSRLLTHKWIESTKTGWQDVEGGDQ